MHKKAVNQEYTPIQMMNFKLFILSLIFLLTSTLLSKAQEVQWLSFEQLADSMEVNPKKIIVDVYTDWCTYCKMMDKQVYAKEEVYEIINQDFYAVRLNAEGKEDITFAGRKFTYQSEGDETGIHELALVLAYTPEGMSFPTTTFVDESYQMLFPAVGFMKKKKFLEVLNYLRE